MANWWIGRGHDGNAGGVGSQAGQDGQALAPAGCQALPTGFGVCIVSQADRVRTSAPSSAWPIAGPHRGTDRRWPPHSGMEPPADAPRVQRPQGERPQTQAGGPGTSRTAGDEARRRPSGTMKRQVSPKMAGVFRIRSCGRRGIPGYRARIRPIVSRITIHWPSFYNVVTGKTLALPNLIALQHIPLSPAGVIAKRPAPIALPNSCAAEWRMAPDAVFSPYASVRYFTPHMVHSQYNLL